MLSGNIQNRYANLIVGGVAKCGTTSLYAYLTHHPEILGSSIKETKFFMPLKFGEQLPPMDNYAKFFEHYKNEKYLLDDSTGYLWGGRTVANAIYNKLGAVKIIFILRDPVSRFFSWYQYAQYDQNIPSDCSFENFLKIAEETFKKDPTVWDNYSRAFIEGVYINVLPEWYDVFSAHSDNIKILFFEHLKENPRKFVDELCAWLDINPSFIADSHLKPENKTGIYRFKWLRSLVVWSRKHPNIVWIRRSAMLRRTFKKLEEKFNKVNRIDILQNIEKEYLGKFYQPYNNHLHQFLISKGYTKFPKWVTESY